MNTLLRPKTACAALDTPTRKSTGRPSLLTISLLLLALAASAKGPRAAAATGDAPQRKRVVVLRRSETVDGARFTLTSDSVLDDYRSYAEGDRLVVLIPRAGLSSTRGQLNHARGFTDLRVEEREADLLISFRLQTGATIAVNQN